MLKLSQMTKSYKKVKILSNLDLEAHSGQITLLYGASGSGKTTLLDVIAGLKFPEIGSYIYQKRDLSQAGDGEMSQFRGETIGYIPQDFAVIEDYTVMDNILLSPQVQKDKDLFEKRARQLAQRLNFSNHLNQKVKHLSGGQKQRVAICRALVPNYGIILADEPTANLDKENVELILKLFEEEKEAGKIIIVATHDERWQEVGNRIYQLDKQKAILLRT